MFGISSVILEQAIARLWSRQVTPTSLSDLCHFLTSPQRAEYRSIESQARCTGTTQNHSLACPRHANKSVTKPYLTFWTRGTFHGKFKQINRLGKRGTPQNLCDQKCFLAIAKSSLPRSRTLRERNPDMQCLNLDLTIIFFTWSSLRSLHTIETLFVQFHKGRDPRINSTGSNPRKRLSSK